MNSHQVAVAFALGGLVMLPPLSLPPLSPWIGWLAATLVVVLFALPYPTVSQLLKNDHDLSMLQSFPLDGDESTS